MGKTTSICVRYGAVTFTSIMTVALFAVTVAGIYIVNSYIVAHNGLAATSRAFDTDTTSRLNLLTAADVALSAALIEGDATVLAALTVVNATLSADVAYLASLLNVTSGSAQAFTESLQALIETGLADRIRSINGVTGSVNDSLHNVDLVSLTPDHLTIIPSEETNTVGLSLDSVIFDVVAGSSPTGGIAVTVVDGSAAVSNTGVITVTGVTPYAMSGNLQIVGTGMITIVPDESNATVTVDGSAIATVLTNLQSMDAEQSVQISGLNDTTSSLQTQINSLQTAGTMVAESLNGTTITFNMTLMELITQLAAAQAAIAELQSQVANVTTTATPIGAIMPYSGAMAMVPSGYLLCDGTSYSTTTYADLFAVVGTMYGNSGGAGTFDVPDLQGKVPVGHKSSGTFNAAVGTAVGAETHALTTPEMPAHTHTATTDSSGDHAHTGTTDQGGVHTHSTQMSDGNNGVLPGDGSAFSGFGNVNRLALSGIDQVITASSSSHGHTFTSASSGTHTHTLTTASTGSGTAHNIVQSSLVVMGWIIKT